MASDYTIDEVQQALGADTDLQTMLDDAGLTPEDIANDTQAWETFKSQNPEEAQAIEDAIAAAVQQLDDAGDADDVDDTDEAGDADDVDDTDEAGDADDVDDSDDSDDSDD